MQVCEESLRHDELSNCKHYKMSATNLKTFHSSSVVEQSAVNRSVAGSNPACGAIIKILNHASMAQQVEHFHGKEGVAGSNPAGSFYKKPCISMYTGFFVVYN